MIKEIALSLYYDIKEECQKNWYTKWLLCLMTLGLVGFGSLKVYRSHTVQKEYQAQVAFSHALDEYNMLIATAKPGDNRWEDLAISLQAVAQKYPKTVYGNFAQVYLADVAVQKGSVEESTVLLEQWLAKNSESNPLYYLYRTKLALLYCDTQDVQKGIALLKELAMREKNKQKDMAQFFLGYYYWTTDNLSQAREFWQPLIDNNKSQSSESNSPWAAIAESKLRYVSSLK